MCRLATEYKEPQVREGTMADSKKSILFQWDGVPSVGELIPLSLQHVVAAVVGIITPAIIIAGVCNLAPADNCLFKFR